ncbi:hypothetical protein [Phenylobacterium montanum]|uniref:ABC-type transport auxiliary lipoprotein component domain-containing protein n=1 Tax=Phenylobacterium montanum TaxID=2823693 RepID=A0A975G2Q2_9CAUL|nr:hypothetical protein [Caulobacter sp. S6]QUD90043.1 hypothetical protein KCG34_09350 [Caulobacter sp. S6]
MSDPSGFSPDSGPVSKAAPTKSPPPPAACLVRFGEVRDLRGDPGTMGEMLNRAVHVTDSATWVRSGLGALAADPHLSIAGDADPTADLVLDVDLVKAYLGSQNMAKTANVVLRVRWKRDGGPEDTSVYRGSMTSINWIGGEAEIRGAFNHALSNLTEDLHRDVLSRCAAATAQHP